MKRLVVRMMRRTGPGLLVLLVACWNVVAATAQPLSPLCTVEALLSCTFHDPISPKVRPWKHPHHSGLVAQSGAPNHSVQDVLVTEGSPITIDGKFTYGDFSKDLEDEPISGFLDTTEGWISLGEKNTDNDGRVRFTITSPLSIGVYDVRLYVGGDASVAEARLWILPRGTHLAIFDIDGTLTTSDKEIIKDVRAEFLPILHKQYIPKAYSGAALLTTAQANRGYVNVYLSGRPYWLANTTRLWLNGPPSFAPGVLHVTDSNKEAVPKEKRVGEFKLNFLKKLVAAGFLLDVAYGNAKTDIYAYRKAGLAPEAIWIIGRYGGVHGTHKVKESWEEQAREVSMFSSISQPWQ